MPKRKFAILRHRQIINCVNYMKDTKDLRKISSPEEAVEMSFPNLLKKCGGLYSQELGINVKNEPFKWLIASILFGARISSSIAKKTYKYYEAAGLTSPEKIATVDEKILIKIHGQGGYARYDGITAAYVHGVAKKLLDEYDGQVKKLDEKSENPRDLELKLQEFRGIGPVTTKIFLRELRGIWRNAQPEPTSIEVVAAKNLGILKNDRDALKNLENFWRKNAVEGFSFRNFEAALVRLGIELRRKKSNQ
jgi:endonuclease III